MEAGRGDRDETAGECWRARSLKIQIQLQDHEKSERCSNSSRDRAPRLTRLVPYYHSYAVFGQAHPQIENVIDWKRQGGATYPATFPPTLLH